MELPRDMPRRGSDMPNINYVRLAPVLICGIGGAGGNGINNESPVNSGIVMYFLPTEMVGAVGVNAVSLTPCGITKRPPE